MSTNTENTIPTPEEIGKLLTKIALADQGFLILLLTAAAKAAHALSSEEHAILAEWGRMIQTMHLGGQFQ